MLSNIVSIYKVNAATMSGRVIDQNGLAVTNQLLKVRIEPFDLDATELLSVRTGLIGEYSIEIPTNRLSVFIQVDPREKAPGYFSSSVVSVDNIKSESLGELDIVILRSAIEPGDVLLNFPWLNSPSNTYGVVLSDFNVEAVLPLSSELGKLDQPTTALHDEHWVKLSNVVFGARYYLTAKHKTDGKILSDVSCVFLKKAHGESHPLFCEPVGSHVGSTNIIYKVIKIDPPKIDE